MSTGPKVKVEIIPDDEELPPEVLLNRVYSDYGRVWAALKQGHRLFLPTEGMTETVRHNITSGVYGWARSRGRHAAVRRGNRNGQTGLFVWLRDDDGRAT